MAQEAEVLAIAMDRLPKRRKKKRILEEEAERNMMPLKWKPKGRK